MNLESQFRVGVFSVIFVTLGFGNVGFVFTQISGTGGVVSLIGMSMIGEIESGGGGGSCGGLFVFAGMLRPPRCGLCE